MLLASKALVTSSFLFLLVRLLVTTSKALVTSSDALVPSSFLFLLVRHLLSRFASAALLRGILSRPRRQHGKKRTISIFTVFTADMVEKKGRPPPVKTVTKETIRFLPFLPRIW